VNPALQVSPSDSLSAVLRRVFAQPKYDWEVPDNPFRFLLDILGRVLEWLAALQEAHPVVYGVLTGAAVGLLIAILVHFGYLIWRTLKPHALPGAVGPEAALRPRDAGWYLSEAGRLAAEGRYAEALAHRFNALVLELDARKALRFHPSKTPAEYALEAQLDAPARGALTDLVRVLYRHLFGGARCSPTDLSAFDRRAAELVTHRAAS
jgi:hypothetical protein